MTDEAVVERFWQVMAIHSCAEDPGPGFGYTVGLATRGLPELHVWDRPTDGDDPAAGFHLSSRDICSILNDLAAEWVSGHLREGDRREIELDGGLTTASFVVGVPVPAEQLEAWRAMPSSVVPLRWSLERPERGNPVPVPVHLRGRYEADLVEVVRLCQAPITVVGGYLPDHRLTFDADERYGPLTTLVGAHARAMAGTDRLGLLIDTALCAEAAISPKALSGHMTTLSRVSGRDAQIHEVNALARRVTTRLRQRRAFRDLAAQMARDAECPISHWEPRLADLVETMFCSTLIGIAMDDVLPDNMRLASQGPWRSVIAEDGEDPGVQWRCSPAAEQCVRVVFSDLTPAGCLQVQRAVEGPILDVVDSGDVMRATGAAITGAMSPPPVLSLVPASCRVMASHPAIHQALTTVGRLIVAVTEGGLNLEAHQIDELELLLGLPLAGVTGSTAA